MRKHRSAEQWQHLVDQQRNSGLSVNDFCVKHGIGYASFCKWRKLRIPVNVNSYSGERERRFFSTHYPDRFVPQVFTFSQLMPLFYA